MAITETPPPAPTPSPIDPEQHAPGDKEMTLLEHLEELRGRLVAGTLAVVVGVIVAIIPIPGFNSITWLAVDALVAIYQLLSFVAPALYENEKRYLYIAVPGVSFSFACGVAFCYFLMLPFATRFLAGFAADVFAPTWTAEHYIDFVSTFLFWVGLTFELPIVMFFLSKMGVISAKRMAGFRKYAFVLAFVIGAVITPTPDPINQTIVSLPIYFLFELGVILARFA